MKSDLKMCKLKTGDFSDNESEIMRRVRNPSHVCAKCLRVSSSREQLCKPRKITKLKKTKIGTV